MLVSIHHQLDMTLWPMPQEVTQCLPAVFAAWCGLARWHLIFSPGTPAFAVLGSFTSKQWIGLAPKVGTGQWRRKEWQTSWFPLCGLGRKGFIWFRLLSPGLC